MRKEILNTEMKRTVGGWVSYPNKLGAGNGSQRPVYGKPVLRYDGKVKNTLSFWRDKAEGGGRELAR